MSSIKLTKDKVINTILILIGMFCQISPLMSRTTIFICIGLCGFLLLLINKNITKMKVGMGIKWYGVFFIYALFSLAYTINTINPDYAVIRMATCLILAVYATQIVNYEKNFDKILEGFIIGGFVGIAIVFANQYNLIGIKRLGGDLYGSYVQFGNVIIITLYSIIWKICQKDMSKRKKTEYILLMIIGFFAAMLSGTRKALFLPIVFYMIMQLINPTKSFGKKTTFLLVMGVVCIFGIYFTINNEFLYSIIGNRIDTLISSITGGTMQDGSYAERMMFKELAKQMIKEKPIFGYGLHGFAYMNYIKNGILVYAHDTFLEILSCLGIIGFILYFRVYFIIIKNAKYMYKEIKKNRIALFFIVYSLITFLMEPYTMSYISQATVLLLACISQYAIDIKKKEVKTSD